MVLLYRKGKGVEEMKQQDVWQLRIRQAEKKENFSPGHKKLN